MSRKLERDFQPELKKEIKRRFPECVIIKQDPNASFQGVPDLLLLCEDKWALLETKRDPSSPARPNQPYYVDKFNKMSFSAFVNPDNMDEVLDDLQAALRSDR